MPLVVITCYPHPIAEVIEGEGKAAVVEHEVQES